MRQLRCTAAAAAARDFLIPCKSIIIVLHTRARTLTVERVIEIELLKFP